MFGFYRWVFLLDFCWQVNGDGETYPVGFFTGNWAGSFAANCMAAILTEEQRRHTHTHTSHIWLYYQNFFGQRFRTAAFVWANLLTRILISRRPPWGKGVKHSWSATKGCWLLKIEIYLFGLPTTPNPLLKVSDQAIARQHCWEEILLGGWLGTLKYTNYS